MKFAYLGQNYYGLEKQYKDQTPLPTIEEVLWKALKKAHLILPDSNPRIENGEVNWDGCEYSKCGRTDKGVSAFGQVIGIRLRSNRLPGPSPSAGEKCQEDNSSVILGKTEDDGSGNLKNISRPIRNDDLIPSSKNSRDADVADSCPVNDEIPYAQILNRLLPPDIRVLAWCPSPPPGFSARFSCKERRYKYFFTQPAFAPTHGASGFKQFSSLQTRREGWLNIEAMRGAAQKFEGLHDFRNFCKVDPGKQTDNFERRIFYAGIEELPSNSGPAGYINLPGLQERQSQTPNGSLRDTAAAHNLGAPRIYTFTLHGSGFLWHQVRYMVAILFLIGQGLESPDLIDSLLDIDKTPEKPMYDMADDAPLVLWDCIFPREGGNPYEDGLDWIYVGQHTGDNETMSPASHKKWAASRHGLGGVMDDLWKVWRQRKIDEVLAGRLLDVVARQGNPSSLMEDEQTQQSTTAETSGRSSQKVFFGGDASRNVGRYVPVLAKPRRARVEVLNARYAARKGFEQDPQLRDQGFRRTKPELATGEEGEERREEGSTYPELESSSDILVIGK